MFRWRSPFRFSLRLLQTYSVKSEPLLDKLKTCKTEYEVFRLLGMNRSALTVHHMGCAVNLLWNFQEGKPENSQTFGQIQDHPEFIVLCSLAQNKVPLLDDQELVDVLYALLMFEVEKHDPLIQQLVVEAWRRLERFDLTTLAKFAKCLKKQDLLTGPLIGQIANLVNKDLEDTDDFATLSSLLVYLNAVSSPSLQERLFKKIDSVIQNSELFCTRQTLRMMRLYYKYKCTNVSMLPKYDNFFKQNINTINARDLSHIVGLYQSLHLRSDFLLMAKPKLIELMESCNDPVTFADLFDVLSRMELQDIRCRLEEKLLTFIDEMDLTQLIFVLKGLAIMKCKNTTLIKKICLILQKHLDDFKPKQLYYITDYVVQLSPWNTKLLEDLQKHLQRNLISNFVPYEVVTLARALSLLEVKQIDEAVLSKIDAIIQQCSISSMEKIALLLTQLSKRHHSSENHHKMSEELLQKLKRCMLQKLHCMDNIDLLLGEVLEAKTRQWMDEDLTEGILDTCQRLLHQVTWRNVGKLSLHLTQMNNARAPILHTIATVTMEDIAKIDPLTVPMILQPFSILNYEPPQGREFFNVCLQHVLEYKDLMNPASLMSSCYHFALAEHFPKELIHAVFNVTFLRQLDEQLQSFPPGLIKSFRYNLMNLNRAVCIECPEFQVPWFHGPYFQCIKRTDMSPSMLCLREGLEEVLEGRHYIRVMITTHYSHFIDFEFVLDKNKKPIPYQEPDRVSDNAEKMCELDGQLPDGAQRFAVELLKAKAFSQKGHLKGRYVMKKRHLEMLGYCVIQIPETEWQSLMRTEREDQILYLSKKIYADT